MVKKGRKTMKQIKKIINIFSFALIGLSSTVMAGNSEPIKIVINEWTGQHISAHISGSVLQKAGYDVEYVTAGAVPQFAAIAQGNLHLQPETWGNNIGEIYPTSVANGDIVVLGETGLKGIESWMYPTYMNEQCPGLPDVKALIECSQLFAVAETFPKGRLIAYPADWGTRSKDMVESADLPFAAIAGGSEGAMIAEMKAAYKTKSPLLMMMWAPHWVHAEMEFDWIEFPDGYSADCLTNPSLGIYTDKVNDCGFKQGNISKIASRNFEEKWPGAFKIMQALTIDNAMQNSLLLEIDNKKRDLSEVILEWMDANEATWKPWVDAAS
tara:strand:+ start:316 stop:1293 length:978 start_codon:yes stop_codon:yes gene_type:complete